MNLGIIQRRLNKENVPIGCETTVHLTSESCVSGMLQMIRLSTIKKKILDTCGLATVYCGSTKLRHENMRV